VRPVLCHGFRPHHPRYRPTRPCWQRAQRNGLVFGSSIATWQLDERHRALHAREAALLFTEDDLLWHR
jgi:endo-1,4-beta-xylanase